MRRKKTTSQRRELDSSGGRSEKAEEMCTGTETNREDGSLKSAADQCKKVRRSVSADERGHRTLTHSKRKFIRHRERERERGGSQNIEDTKRLAGDFELIF